MGQVSALPETTVARLLGLRAVHTPQATVDALNTEGLIRRLAQRGPRMPSARCTNAYFRPDG